MIVSIGKSRLHAITAVVHVVTLLVIIKISCSSDQTEIEGVTNSQSD